MKDIVLRYPVSYDIEVIRYVSYMMTSDFWVFVSKSGNFFQIRLTPKKDGVYDLRKIKKRFEDELKYEIFRKKLLDKNADFRFHIIKKAITYTPPSQEELPDALTPEEQKELERLIKEAEEEIKKELQKEKDDDIRKTWEEKYGKKVR
ncbi:MAG: hypothetical protein ACP5IO_00825 [Elusimicrobiales bacterium]